MCPIPGWTQLSSFPSPAVYPPCHTLVFLGPFLDYVPFVQFPSSIVISISQSRLAFCIVSHSKSRMLREPWSDGRALQWIEVVGHTRADK